MARMQALFLTTLLVIVLGTAVEGYATRYETCDEYAYPLHAFRDLSAGCIEGSRSAADCSWM